MYFRKKEFVQAANGINRQIEVIERKISMIKPADIVCRRKGNSVFYSEVSNEGERGITRDKKRIRELVEKEYFEAQLGVLKNNRDVLIRCANKYRDDSDETIMETLSKKHPNMPIKQILTSPAACLSNTQKNNTMGYQKNPFYQEDLKFVTTNGVYLRSKSEREIGNALESVGVEYDSDVLIQCGNARYYADFIIKRRNGTKLVWEHFGREDDSVYMAKNKVRINDYIAMGLRPWEDLIWTLDSDIEDSRTIRRIIQRFILSELDQ